MGKVFIDLQTQRVVNQITEAAVFAAGRMVEELEAEMVIVASASGKTALALSKDRLYVPAIGVSDSPETLRRMNLYWGVIPLPGAPTGRQPRAAKPHNHLGPHRRVTRQRRPDRANCGDGLAVTARNMIVVHEIE